MVSFSQVSPPEPCAPLSPPPYTPHVPPTVWALLLLFSKVRVQYLFPRFFETTCVLRFLLLFLHALKILRVFGPLQIFCFKLLYCFLEFAITNWQIKCIFSCCGFCTSIFCLRVLYSPLAIFDFLLAYVPFFCAHVKVHANVLAIPLSLVITSLFPCIGTLLLQEVWF